MQADVAFAPVDHTCLNTPGSAPVVDEPDGSGAANADLAATASAALAAVNQLRSNTSPDQFEDIMAALTRNREDDDSSKCSENKRKRRGSASRGSADASHMRTAKKVVRKPREEALQHLSMIATKIYFTTTNGDQHKTIVAYNKVDGITRVLAEGECEVLQFGPALPDEAPHGTTGAAPRETATSPVGTEESEVHTVVYCISHMSSLSLAHLCPLVLISLGAGGKLRDIF